ncbi:HAUS augmin-like complex subunit 5 isoform X2 [Dysidea avara]|uniref:HAUS augmin-like complex subunit 5 isoform X2 n=1 Tax=Dysidea avara TaxID=196820 RepID=UPI0033169C42
MNNSEASDGSRLQHWATNVMGYAGTMTAQDWKQLCQGDLGQFWLNVVNNVQPSRTVATLRGTLLLHSSTVPLAVDRNDDERQLLLEQRNKLARELGSLQNGIRLRDAEIDHLHAKISSLERDHVIHHDGGAELMTRCSLLSGQQRSCDQLCQVIQEYQQRITLHNKFLTSCKADHNDVSYVMTGHGATQHLESVTMHVVRDALSCVKQLLCVLGESDSDKSLVQKAKERAWTSVEQLLGNHSIRDILWSLCDIAVETGQQLRKDTSDIDLQRDTQQLKFQCQTNSGELKDISTQPSLLQAIQFHVKEAQKDHVTHSQSIKQFQQTTQDAQQKLVLLQQQVNQLLGKHYQARPTLLKLARTRVKLDRELAGSRAALQALLLSEHALRASCDKKQTLLQQLQQKSQRIQEYTDRTGMKQDKIHQLVRHNSDAKQQLLKQRREVISYAQQKVMSQHVSLVVSADQLKDNPDHEAVILSKLKLQQLPHHELNRVGLVCEALGCHSYQRHELMLEKVVELLEKTDELRKELKERELCVNEVRVDTSLLEVHSKFMEEINQHTQLVILPQLHNQLNRTHSAIQQCDDIKASIGDWWTQPAQVLVPWLTQQGMNINQWLEQWRTLVMRLEEI